MALAPFTWKEKIYPKRKGIIVPLIKREFPKLAFFNPESKKFVITDFGDEYREIYSYVDYRLPINFKYDFEKDLIVYNYILASSLYSGIMGIITFSNNETFMYTSSFVSLSDIFTGYIDVNTFLPINYYITYPPDLFYFRDDIYLYYDIMWTNCGLVVEVKKLGLISYNGIKRIPLENYSKYFGSIITKKKTITKNGQNFHLYGTNESKFNFILEEQLFKINAINSLVLGTEPCYEIPILQPLVPTGFTLFGLMMDIELWKLSLDGITIWPILYYIPVQQHQFQINSIQSESVIKFTNKIWYKNFSYNIEPIFQIFYDKNEKIYLFYKTHCLGIKLYNNPDDQPNLYYHYFGNDTEDKMLLPDVAGGIREDNYLFIEGPIFTKIVPTYSYKDIYYNYDPEILLIDNLGSANDGVFNSSYSFPLIVGFLKTKSIICEDFIKEIANDDNIPIKILFYRGTGYKYRHHSQLNKNSNIEINEITSELNGEKKATIYPDSDLINYNLILGKYSYSRLDEAIVVSIPAFKDVLIFTSYYKYKQLHETYQEIDFINTYNFFGDNDIYGDDYEPSQSSDLSYKLPFHLSIDKNILLPNEIIGNELKCKISEMGYTVYDLEFKYDCLVLIGSLSLERDEFKMFYDTYFNANIFAYFKKDKKYIIGTKRCACNLYYINFDSPVNLPDINKLGPNRIKFLYKNFNKKFNYIFSIVKIPVTIKVKFSIGSKNINNPQGNKLFKFLPIRYQGYPSLTWYAYQEGNNVYTYSIKCIEFHPIIDEIRTLFNLKFENHYLSFPLLKKQGNLIGFHNDRALFVYNIKNNKVKVYDFFNESFIEEHGRFYFSLIGNFEDIDLEEISFKKITEFEI